jgi:hypothetical protein
MSKRTFIARFTRMAFLGAAILILGTEVASAQKSIETIDANAMGTSTQMGRNVPIKMRIYRYSTPEEREVLVQAFKKGQNQGLVKALEKMKSVGQISLPGTVGYSIAFIREIPTPTGRKIRFVTNRLIRFGEARNSTRSMDYNLTAGEIDINTSDKKKTSGTLLPAAQFIINEDGELQFELYQNPYKLVNIIEWNAKDKEE